MRAAAAAKGYDGSMRHASATKPVTVARIKTAKVQSDMRQAASELHEANEDLAQSSAVGTMVTRDDVHAALVQNIAVEGQLHDAVEELRVVTDLLKTAEQDKARAEDALTAGKRSGEGLESVIEHIQHSTKGSGDRER